MKYFVLMCDGMADRKLPDLAGKSPMEAAVKPTVNMLSYRSFNGMISYPAQGTEPSLPSVTLAVLGSAGDKHAGPAPFEAASMGIELDGEDTVYRCSLVTLSESGSAYSEKKLVSAHDADITPEEASKLVSALNKGLSTKIKKFYTGSGAELCLLWKRAPAPAEMYDPAQITGKRIADYLPSGESAARLLPMFEKSYAILNDHPVNVKRRQSGKKPLNSIWLWAAGKRPEIEDFDGKWKVNSAAVCDDPVVSGAVRFAGIRTVDVPQSGEGENYDGKAAAALDEFKSGADLVFLHIGSIMKATLDGDAQAKVRAIEDTDSKVLAPVYEYLCGCGDQFKILLTTGAAASVEDRAYTTEQSPFFMYNSTRTEVGYKPFSELNAAKSGFYLPEGYKFMPFMIRLPAPEKEETPDENGQ